MSTDHLLTPEALCVFETLPDAYLILTPQLSILTASQAYLAMTHTSRDTIVGRNFFDVFPDNPALQTVSATRNLLTSFQQVLLTRQAHQMALHRYDIPSSGRDFIQKYWLTTNTPVLDAQGEVAYLIHKAEDVTQQQMTQQTLQENQNLLRTVFDAAPLSLTVLQTLYDQAGAVEDFEIRIFNAFTIRTTGVTDYLGKRYSQVFPHTIPSGVLDAFKQVASMGETADFERWYQGEGMHHWFRFIAVRQDPFLVVITEDITERKNASQDLLAANEELKAANEQIQNKNAELQAANEQIQNKNAELQLSNQLLTRINNDLDNFVYSASHDLKAPIANIEGLMKFLFASLPPEAFASERVQKTSEMIDHSITRFKRTIGHMTEVTKLQKESNQPAVSVDLTKLIREVRLDLAPQIDAAKAVLDVDLPASLSIQFSEKNLRSIVYNLLSNALKYRSEERIPLIRIQCQQEGSFVVFSIRDNGLGINLSKATKLFAMFGRLHDHVEGSGIGLYMVKKIIENAGGRIEVESKVGEGSTFRVHFPN